MKTARSIGRIAAMMDTYGEVHDLDTGDWVDAASVQRVKVRDMTTRKAFWAFNAQHPTKPEHVMPQKPNSGSLVTYYYDDGNGFAVTGSGSWYMANTATLRHLQKMATLYGVLRRAQPPPPSTAAARKTAHQVLALFAPMFRQALDDDDKHDMLMRVMREVRVKDMHGQRSFWALEPQLYTTLAFIRPTVPTPGDGGLVEFFHDVNGNVGTGSGSDVWFMADGRTLRALRTLYAAWSKSPKNSKSHGPVSRKGRFKQVKRVKPKSRRGAIAPHTVKRNGRPYLARKAKTKITYT